MIAMATEAFHLDAVQPITPQIHRHLRERIIRNELTPGNRISEAEIAQACAVSRQPVREAFIKLAEQGLLAVRPQRGTIVSRIAYGAVLDARFMREAIEADIVAILASAPDAGVIRSLRRQIDAHRDVPDADPVGFIEADEQFHRMLADAAGKGGAWTLLEGLKAQMDRVRFLSLGCFPRRKLIDQHARVVDRIAAADGAGANAAIRHHLREVLVELPAIRDANPAFFDMPAGDIPAPVNAPIKGGNDT
jgi:DNA-binding GntR family transcriptional regulator